MWGFPSPQSTDKKRQQKFNGMHLRIPFPPKTTDIKRQSRNQMECICAFPSPQNNRHKKTKQKSTGMHLRIPFPQTTDIKRHNRNHLNNRHKKTEKKSKGNT